MTSFVNYTDYFFFNFRLIFGNFIMFKFSLITLFRLALFLPTIYIVYGSWKLGFFRNPVFYYSVTTSISVSLCLMSLAVQEEGVNHFRETLAKLIAERDSPVKEKKSEQ